jgi:hypothetical protein
MEVVENIDTTNTSSKQEAGFNKAKCHPEFTPLADNSENNKENRGHDAKRHEEHQYLDQIRLIFNSGRTKSDRTGVGTKSVNIESNKYCQS